MDQLKHAIQGQFGTRRKGGRPVKLPVRPRDGLQEMLDVVIALRRRWSAWQAEAAKPKRSAKSRAVISLLEKLDHETRELSQAVHGILSSKANRRAFA